MCYEYSLNLKEREPSSLCQVRLLLPLHYVCKKMGRKRRAGRRGLWGEYLCTFVFELGYLLEVAPDWPLSLGLRLLGSFHLKHFTKI